MSMKTKLELEIARMTLERLASYELMVEDGQGADFMSTRYDTEEMRERIAYARLALAKLS